MSIVNHPAFNMALTELAIGTHNHLPNDEIFLVEAIDAYVAAAVAAERAKWLKVIIRSYSSGVHECRICGGRYRPCRVYVKHMDWCPAYEEATNEHT
jgi:hypothetical protein